MICSEFFEFLEMPPCNSDSSQAIKAFSFAAGSMGPKVQAAIEFVEHSGGCACIGPLKDVTAVIDGEAGTLISKEITETVWWD